MTYHYVKQAKVWRPDIALRNSYDGYRPVGDDDLHVILNSYGWVQWNPLEIFLSVCSIDLTYYPFDVQHCQLIFTAWSYTESEVILVADNAPDDLAQYHKNSAWDLTGTSWSTESSYGDSEITFTIKLKRKPSYSVITLVFPVITLCILNLFVFALPCDCGEKASYAITVFLAFIVFLTIMEASFPRNSDKVSYFAILVIVQISQSILIMIVSLLLIRCSSFGDESPVPSWLVAFVRCIRCKSRPARPYSNKIGAVSLGMVLEAVGDAEAKEKVARGIEDDVTPPEEQVTWKYCVASLDLCCFFFFLITDVASILFYFISIS